MFECEDIIAELALNNNHSLIQILMSFNILFESKHELKAIIII
jgi:hypothetical protein